MFYILVKYTMRIVYRVFFRKIYFVNMHRMPKNAPVVMPVNHPTAFTEPVMMGVFLRRSIHFILKGNMFSTPLLRWILNDLKTIPIFRMRDGKGFAGLRQNAETMEIVNEKLKKNQAILILAEGVRKNEKRLRPIQKGAARMAFKYHKTTNKDDLAIVCVGFNYAQATKYRSDVMIDMAEPRYLSEYVDLYQENDRKAINQLTKDIEKDLKERVIHIDKEENDEVFNAVLDLFRNDRETSIFPIIENNPTPLKEEMELIQTMNQLNASDLEVLSQKVNSYQQLLASQMLKDLAVSTPPKAFLPNAVLWLIGLIPALIGWVSNIIPMNLSRSFTEKNAKTPEDLASLYPATALIFYLLYGLIILILSVIFLGWKGIVVLPSLMLLGYVYVLWKENNDRWAASRAFYALTVAEQSAIKNLRAEIKSLVRQ